MGVETIAIMMAVGAMASAGSTVYASNKQAKLQGQANEQARKAQADQEHAARMQLEEQKKNNAQMKTDREKDMQLSADQLAGNERLQDRDSARARQRAAAQGAQGRSDTILTGPLGLTGEAQTARKTILGA